MATSILVTKLYIPPTRLELVHRPRLVERLNEGLHRKLTLISAPVGYGKTTILSEWIPQSERCVAWVSLDVGDNDPVRFWAYFIAALQMLDAKIGRKALPLLRTRLLLPIEEILTVLLNEIAAFPDNFALVLDDYHVLDAKPVDKALTFLLEHLPPQMHLIITTREDPNLPLARLRARDQLTELRAADLRFTTAEAAEFLNQEMGVDISADDIAILETRTEGWIAGLQLAALSARGRKDVHEFISAFAGDNRYIGDYLVEEVLQRQPERVRNFLLQTSILDWLCGPLCDAVTAQQEGKAMLETLERGNLFISALDDKRYWFRYHHLLADVLHVHLMKEQPDQVPSLHKRASEWYEHNGLEIEAFQHAAAANDIERAEHLIEVKGMPLQFRGAGAHVLNWLQSLPKTALDARPSLWVTYASTLLFGDQHTAVEQKLEAAEAALAAAVPQGTEPEDRTKDLIGRIASMRATLAVIQHDVETIINQSRRALAYLHPDNLQVRTATTWSLGYAYQLQGDRAAASQVYTEVISIGKSFGDSIYTTAATINLGQIQEANNQLYIATETYRRALQLAGDPPQRMASEAYLGLARITYEWNDLDTAQQLGQQCAELTRQMESVSTVASYGVFFARLRLAHRDISGAIAVLDEAEEFVRRHNFVFMMPEIVTAQVITMLHQGNLAAAAHLAEKHELPISQARVYLAQGDPAMALAVLEPLRKKVEARGWVDERLKIMILQAVALHAHGENERAIQGLGDALALAEPGGFIRIFVDEGQSMALMLNETLNRGIAPNYVQRLLTAFPSDDTEQASSRASSSQTRAPKSELDETLSQRELEVLRLIAQGLSNREISERLYLALNTVKGHNQKIYSKLQVQSRTEAVARARELDLL
jgi:LuxR family transcriptional regulator, maltose regulon positive regulatory protein